MVVTRKQTAYRERLASRKRKRARIPVTTVIKAAESMVYTAAAMLLWCLICAIRGCEPPMIGDVIVVAGGLCVIGLGVHTMAEMWEVEG